ncbi:MAG: hypothetical protein NXI31_12500 [bacterium]|nr:hypothetical protein [bacterium]
MSRSVVFCHVLSAVLLTTTLLSAQCPRPRSGGGGSSTPGQSPSGVPGPSTPGPGGPSTPGPGGPSQPGPSDPGTGPTTGGPSGPSAPGFGPTTGGPGGGPAAAARPGRTGARGAVMTFARGRTSKDRLKMDWEHPVPAERGEGTSAAGALPLADALAQLWGDDTRPLLVLRECNLCQGSDRALLNVSLNNDRTKLLASWFRVVKLPPHVTQESHPFYNVFAGQGFEGALPHFYLLSSPTSKPVAFTGRPTQGRLLASMTGIIKERYQLDPKRAIKKWLALLDKFDMLDAQRKRVKEQWREARAEKGPRSSRAKKLQAKLDKIEKDRARLLNHEKKVRNLVLHPFPKGEKIAAAK